MYDLQTILRACTISFGVMSFLLVFLINLFKRKENSLERLLTAGIGGSSIPTGFVLIYCAFDSEMLQQLTGISIYVAFAGLALVFVAFKTIKEQL